MTRIHLMSLLLVALGIWVRASPASGSDDGFSSPAPTGRPADNPRPRAREAGVVVGIYPAGLENAITDVAGVQVRREHQADEEA